MKRWWAWGWVVPQLWVATVAGAPGKTPVKNRAPAEQVFRQGPGRRQMGPTEVLGNITLLADVLAFAPSKRDQLPMRLQLSDIDELEVAPAPWGGDALRVHLKRGSEGQRMFGDPLLGVKDAPAWRDAIERVAFRSGAMTLRPRTPGKPVILGDAAFSLPQSWNVFAQDEVTATNADGTLSVWVYQRDATGAAALDALAKKPPPLPHMDWETRGKTSAASPGRGVRTTEYVGVPDNGVRAYFHYAVVGSPGGKALLFLVKCDEQQKEQGAQVLQNFLGSLAFAP